MIGPPLVGTMPAGSPLVRIVPLARGAGGALFFGPAAGKPPMHRFDASQGEFRVCYLAESPRSAVAETLLRLASAPLPPLGIRMLDRTAVSARGWAWTVTVRPLRLADLRSGDGLARRHHTGELTMSASHLDARREAVALHALEETVDGIWYRARHDPAESVVALFDRAASSLATVATIASLLDDPITIGGLLDHYGVGLDPQDNSDGGVTPPAAPVEFTARNTADVLLLVVAPHLGPIRTRIALRAPPSSSNSRGGTRTRDPGIMSAVL